MNATAEPDGRTLHYGHFYGVLPDESDDRPLAVVWGNCQAEATRLMLESAGAPWRSVRVPPVHELTDDDIPHVRKLFDAVDVLISQPVRDGYRELPIGTSDVIEMATPSLTVVRWPVFRYGGLFPFQLIVRDPDDPSADPPGVPYHDLRTVIAARDGASVDDEWDVDLTPEMIRSASERSVTELRRREERDTDVAISDVLVDAGAGVAHTINHPGNTVLATLAERILAAYGAESTRPTADHDLLGEVRSPVEQRVLDAFDLDAPARDEWLVGDDTVAQRDIAEQQLRWYAERPAVVDAALERYAELIDLFGLAR